MTAAVLTTIAYDSEEHMHERALMTQSAQSADVPRMILMLPSSMCYNSTSLDLPNFCLVLSVSVFLCQLVEIESRKPLLVERNGPKFGPQG